MEFNWWYLILDEIVMLAILTAGVTFFVSKSLVKVKKLVTGEVKEYLQVVLEEHKEDSVERVSHHVENQLEGLKVELKSALADKIVAQKATIVAEEATVVAEKAQVIAEEESDGKTEFLSRMSHEIRTPMNGIIGSLDLIDLDTVTKDQAEDIQRAVRSSNRLLSVIDEILTFSSVNADGINYNHKAFNLYDLCLEVTNSLRPLAEKKGLMVNLNIEDLHAKLRHGDEQKIHQVLTNLLGNAIKFTEQGQVSLKVEESEDSWVHFQVMDTGVGIDEDELESLFDPFYQVDESNTRRYGGTGLGLAISKKFAEGMGGEITVRSTPGEGSCFQFKIPLRIERQKETKDESTKLKILVVDDDEINRIVAKRCLSDACDVVDEARDGKEALSMFQDKFYDLVLMDVQMPVMDGLEACRQIRRYEGELMLDKTPVVAISASVVGNIVEECETAGMDGHISKPFKKSLLVRDITNILENFNQP